MRNMAFGLTTAAFKDRTKTVTRRMGWKFLKPGDIVMGVVNSQGIKQGELKVLHAIEIVSVRRENLLAMNDYAGECAKEGFPTLEPWEFIRMFCKHMKCEAMDIVNRIEFKHL